MKISGAKKIKQAGLETIQYPQFFRSSWWKEENVEHYCLCQN